MLVEPVEYEIVARYLDFMNVQLKETMPTALFYSCSLLVSQEKVFFREHGIDVPNKKEKTESLTVDGSFVSPQEFGIPRFATSGMRVKKAFVDLFIKTRKLLIESCVLKMYEMFDVQYKGQTYSLFLIERFERDLGSRKFVQQVFSRLVDSIEYARFPNLYNYLIKQRDIVNVEIMRTFSENIGVDEAKNSNGQSVDGISILNEIASTYYESEAVSGTIQFVNDINDITLDVKLEDPLSICNSRVVRKLLVVADKAIIVVYKNQVIGFSEKLIGTKNHEQTVKMLGHMKWGYYIGGKEQFRMIDSKLVFRADPFKGINTILGKWFYHFDIRYEDTIKQKLSFKKGAVIIITNDAQREAKRLCKLHRGIEVSPFSIFDHSNAIVGIARMDGAIILDKKGVCYAVGVILDGEAMVLGNQSRGSRYNSTKNYIFVKNKSVKTNDNRSQIRYVGIVVSEDGMVDVFEPSK